MHTARRYDVLALALVTLPTAAALAAWPVLPETLAIQWGLGGSVTNTASRATAILGIAGIAVGAIVLVRANVGSTPTTPRVRNATVLFVGFVFGAVQSIILTKNLGFGYDPMVALVPILVAAFGFTWYVLTHR